MSHTLFENAVECESKVQLSGEVVIGDIDFVLGGRVAVGLEDQRFLEGGFLLQLVWLKVGGKHFPENLRVHRVGLNYLLLELCVMEIYLLSYIVI
jgi:hypothetical protein